MSVPFDHTDLPVRLLAAFQQSFPMQTPERIVRAPDREMWIAASVASAETFTLVAADQDSRAVFTWRTARAKRTVTNRPLPKWARYPAGILLALSETGIAVPGIDGVIVGEEPLGPRYDYALGMVFAALAYQLGAHPYTTETLIELVDHVRRDYVDT